MDRKPLSGFLGRQFFTQFNDAKQVIEFVNVQGRVVATVPVDDLFDADGNHFHRDA